MFRFLFSDDSVCKMIGASELKLPTLSFILGDIEKVFGKEDSLFPIIIGTGVDVDKNKKNVGRMVQEILKLFGYEKNYEKEPDAVPIPESFIKRPSNKGTSLSLN